LALAYSLGLINGRSADRRRLKSQARTSSPRPICRTRNMPIWKLEAGAQISDTVMSSDALFTS
jgi:hypothetical protein